MLVGFGLTGLWIFGGWVEFVCFCLVLLVSCLVVWLCVYGVDACVVVGFAGLLFLLSYCVLLGVWVLFVGACVAFGFGLFA